MRYLVLLIVVAMFAAGACSILGVRSGVGETLQGVEDRVVAGREPAERAEHWQRKAAVAGTQAARQGEILAGVVLTVGGVLAGLLAAAVQSVDALRRELAGRRP